MLNQIIIEGTVTKDSFFKEEEGKNRSFLSIPIASKKFYRDFEGKMCEEVTFFEARAWGSEDYLRTIEHNAKKGRGIRLVGKLSQESGKSGNKKTSRLYITSEHIEFKPDTKKSEEKAS